MYFRRKTKLNLVAPPPAGPVVARFARITRPNQRLKLHLRHHNHPRKMRPTNLFPKRQCSIRLHAHTLNPLLSKNLTLSLSLTKSNPGHQWHRLLALPLRCHLGHFLLSHNQTARCSLPTSRCSQSRLPRAHLTAPLALS